MKLKTYKNATMTRMNKKFVLQAVFGLVSGFVGGVVLLFLLASTPLLPDNTVYKTFGIQKPYIIGFQPFWLLDTTTTQYNQYVNTFTYFGLVLDTNGKIVKLVNEQEEEPGWTTLRTKKLASQLQQAKNSNMKISLLLHLSDEEKILALLSDPVTHANNTIQEVAPIMKQYGFNDLNLDVESFTESSEENRKQFTQYVKEIKKGLDQNNLGTLTIEASPTVLIKKYVIDLKHVSPYADFIVLMTYDFHYLGSYVTGPVAPINGAGTVREYDVETGIQEAIKIIPAQKIILGIPFYGYEWETVSNTPGAAVIPLGASTASYARIAKLLKDCTTCIKGIDKTSQEPYIIVPDKESTYYRQIFYEDKTSFAKKLKLAQKYKLGGVALWALGYEEEGLLTPLRSYKNSFILKGL